MDEHKIIGEICRMNNGKIIDEGNLPYDSDFACISFPLPKDHWLICNPDENNVPPMPFCMGINHPCRKGFEKALRDAGRYACRCATMNGKDMNFDPDSLIQNLIVGFLGYHTETGLSSDEKDNPQNYRINQEDKMSNDISQ